MRRRATLRVGFGAAILIGLLWLIASPPTRATGQDRNEDAVEATHGQAHGTHTMANMTEAEMEAWSAAWWGTHRPVGASSHQVANATFTVTNFRFDTDNSAATQVDTATISVGESITWSWVTGGHTITNGTGSGDPAVGTLFDQPSDVNHKTFTFTFNNPGNFPFFCRPHEFSNMKGVVKVLGSTNVPPLAGSPIGFTSDPAPNPSRAGASFAFALRVAGRCRADVFDARGRRVALVMDEELLAGPHAGSWDGRTNTGTEAPAGLYYLRLTLPGYAASRPIAIAR